MKHLTTNSIRKIKPYTPGRPIEEVKRELGLRRIIKLASNESPYPPSPKVIKAIEQSTLQINRYPDANCFDLRKALAKKHRIKEDQIVFGNGSDEIIVLAVKAFVKKGDEVVIAQPSFLIYDIASRIAGAEIKTTPLKDFRYDLDGMLRAVTEKTKLIFIGNPDNPAGTYVSAEQLENFLKSVSSDVLIFVDEAYFEYVSDKEYPDSLALLKKYKNIIVSRTFSKMYGLAGLRVGYGMMRAETADILNRIREPFNVNVLAQKAALACLQDEKYYRGIAREIKVQRQLLIDGVTKLGLQTHPSVTNFILINCRSEARAVAAALILKGVIVRDMSFWGLKTYIRVTIGSPKENIAFLKALKSVIKV